MSNARDAYEENGVKMRSFNAVERREMQSNTNYLGFTRTTVFKFKDGSEVELHQVCKKQNGGFPLISTTEKFAE
jgi:hypothetical protein